MLAGVKRSKKQQKIRPSSATSHEEPNKAVGSCRYECRTSHPRRGHLRIILYRLDLEDRLVRRGVKGVRLTIASWLNLDGRHVPLLRFQALPRVLEGRTQFARHGYSRMITIFSLFLLRFVQIVSWRSYGAKACAVSLMQKTKPCSKIQTHLPAKPGCGEYGTRQFSSVRC